jgi:integrase
MVGSASGKQVDAEAALGGPPVTFDSLMMRRVVEYNPAARAKPPRLVRESSHTPVFEEAEIVAFLDSISSELLKDVRDKAILSVFFYSWCRVSALINLTVADYYERGGTRWFTVPRKTRESTRSTGALESKRSGR